jgi:predicted metal-dependent peptidase
MTPAEKRFTEAKTAMLVHVPFFSSLLFDIMDVKVGDFPDMPTAATDGRTIWLNENFFGKLKLPEAVGVICHEIGHAIYQHMARAKAYEAVGLHGKPFNQQKANVAMDFVINDMLTQCGIKLPNVALLDKQFTCDMTWEEVYAKLPDNESRDSMDQHIHGNPGGAPSQAEMARAVATAAESAKAQGKLPGALKRFADEVLSPQVTWQERLRHSVSKAIARDGTTWAKPHRRRLLTQGVYLPAMTGFGAGDLVIVVDTSGSIGQKEINCFFSEVDEILSACNPESVALLGCDAAINSVHHVEAGTSLFDAHIELGGGGGTDFRPPFQWVEENFAGGMPAALIYFTDMMGSFPEHPPGYPVIWCRIYKGEAPFGEIIDVEVK